MEKFPIAASNGGKRHQRQAPTSFHTKAFMANWPKARQLGESHFSSHLRQLVAAKDHRLQPAPEDTELSIFDAERYFKEGQDQTVHRRQGKGPVSDHGIPTSSSEARWRIQSNSLSNPPGPLAVTAVRTSPLNKQRRGPSSTCRWPLSGPCPCSGKEAIDVEEKYFSLPISPNHLNLDTGAVSLVKKEPGAGEAACGAAAAAGGGRAASPTEYELGLEMEEMVTFKYFGRETVQLVTPCGDGGGSSYPVLRQTVAPTMKAPNRVSPPDDSPRASFEVFQPAEEATAMTGRSVELCHRRQAMRPLMFPADGAPRRSFTFPGSPRARLSSVLEEDLTSDSSSDLFELESFSARTRLSRPTYQCWRVSLNEVTMVEGFAREKVADFCTAASGREVGGESAVHHEVSKDGAGGGERGCERPLSCRFEERGCVSPRPAAGFGKEQQHHHGRRECRHLPTGPLDAMVRPTAPEGKANSASTALPRVSVASPDAVAMHVLARDIRGLP